MPPTAMVTLVFSGLPCACAWPKVNQPARNSASAIRNCFQNFLLYMLVSYPFSVHLDSDGDARKHGVPPCGKLRCYRVDKGSASVSIPMRAAGVLPSPINGS
ncbi:exported hypothetical protein [Cupriavidus oxalaticus]|uniref:Uncharacterized protein n=1 Tax=Cupriavidus oxalaticus TaxID=96344 RepID=A0A375G2N8_9BURK|nr:exported hypothetical protein [Cupriavidus oxalaticus]